MKHGQQAAAVVTLALDGVTAVHRDGTTALEALTLSVDSGELLAVVGPSGSGKTTLLRAVAGLADVRVGRVLLDGADVTRVPTGRRDVAMVFESGALLPFLDVAGNLELGLRFRHVPQPVIQDRVSSQARRLRLTQLLTRRPAGLSAGERGRVGIGRALARAPGVWLLDEPLAHLDPVQRADLRRWLVREVQRQGVTTVYVTHDPAEALAVGDRVAVLARGRLAQVGRPRDLYERPASIFVADFVAPQPIGLLPARVVCSAGLGGFQVGARTLPLWAPLPPALAELVGAPVVLGLRPEDVYDAATVDDPSYAHVAGRVVRAEYTGRDTAVTVEIDAPPLSSYDRGESPRPERARLEARFPRQRSVRDGAAVTVAVDASRAHVFDPATGLALWNPIPEPRR